MLRTAGDTFAAGEDVETMLPLKSVLPLIAGLSANHLAALDLFPALRRLYVTRDSDPAGLTTLRWLRESVDIRELAPLNGDFNLDLRHFGAGAMLARLVPQLDRSDLARFAGASALASASPSSPRQRLSQIAPMRRAAPRSPAALAQAWLPWL